MSKIKQEVKHYLQSYLRRYSIPKIHQSGVLRNRRIVDTNIDCLLAHWLIIEMLSTKAFSDFVRGVKETTPATVDVVRWNRTDMNLVAYVRIRVVNQWDFIVRSHSHGDGSGHFHLSWGTFGKMLPLARCIVRGSGRHGFQLNYELNRQSLKLPEEANPAPKVLA